MQLNFSCSRVVLGACLLVLLIASWSFADSTPPAVEQTGEHSDLEVLTTCQMFIYSSIVLWVYDLASVENLAKSKLCGVEKNFTPAQSLEEISRLFAEYGMEKTASQYNITFDDAYIKQVLGLTEIIIKTYQAGYEKALRQQLEEHSGNHVFCTAFRRDMQLDVN
jgi:hypothetical protein